MTCKKKIDDISTYMDTNRYCLRKKAPSNRRLRRICQSVRLAGVISLRRRRAEACVDFEARQFFLEAGDMGEFYPFLPPLCPPGCAG